MMSDLKDKTMVVEHIESQDQDSGYEKPKAFGTVRLVTHNEVVLIPTPSQDPRDPLNLPAWRRLVIMIVTSLFGTLALTVVSGVGAIIGFFLPEYLAEGRSEAEITHLFTLPALAMGLGNFVSVPLALAVGRRPVFLASLILLSLASVLCATNKGYNWHLGARIVLGLAAGQSEALTPMMIQETHFLHERGAVLTWQWLIQSTLGGLLSTISSYQTAALGLRWWYGFYAITSFVLFIVAFFFVPETKYDRPIAAYVGLEEGGRSKTKFTTGRFSTDPKAPKNLHRITTKTARKLDNVNFKPRTFLSDLRIIVREPDWKEALLCYKHMAQLIMFPNVFWVVMMNGVLLGINVSVGELYGSILLAKPYSWASSSVGFAQGGQIVAIFLGFPLLGYFSDWVVKFMSRRNGGVHEPEFRLIPLVIPTITGILACVLFGEAGSYPYKFHWFAIIFGYCGQFFSFVGASIAGQTYLLDAFPSRQGSVLVLVCAARGVIQFGLSFGVSKFSAEAGYATVFGTYGGLTAIFGLLGGVVYFTGKRIRNFTEKWATDEHDKDSKHLGEAYNVAIPHDENNYMT